MTPEQITPALIQEAVAHCRMIGFWAAAIAVPCFMALPYVIWKVSVGGEKDGHIQWLGLLLFCAVCVMFFLPLCINAFADAVSPVLFLMGRR